MKTILVVDDLPASRRLLATFLGDDFRVIEAADGRECLEMASREHPDLVLLDLSLPGLDGIRVIERIRSDPDLSTTPIFALTAHTLKEYEERAVAAGCNEYIVKPFGLDELRELVDRTLADTQRG
jgi:CheY-like chemotaxis protein